MVKERDMHMRNLSCLIKARLIILPLNSKIYASRIKQRSDLLQFHILCVRLPCFLNFFWCVGCLKHAKQKSIVTYSSSLGLSLSHKNA